MQPTFPVFAPEAPQTRAILEQFVVVLAISGVIFAIVSGLIVVALVRGRARRALPEQEFGRASSEIAWMVAPVLVLLWIGAISAKLVLTMNALPVVDSAAEASHEVGLVVVGHQWWWETRYPGTDVVTANEVHIPSGRRIRVEVGSADVVHSFWVPQLARKIDAIPGRRNYVWLEAERPGIYQGRCSEFCGTQHAWMNFTVHVHAPEDYATWLAGAADVTGRSLEGDALAGKTLFLEKTCSNCHAIRGTTAVANIGPDLTHLPAREWLAGGAIRNSNDNLAVWLRNPQAVKPGCKMPNFRLTEAEVLDLVAYLEAAP